MTKISLYQHQNLNAIYLYCLYTLNIKFSDLFRKIYIYILSNYEVCALKSVILKDYYRQFIIKILINMIIIFMRLKNIIFMSFKRYYRYDYYNHRCNASIAVYIYVIYYYYQALIF